MMKTIICLFHFSFISISFFNFLFSFQTFQGVQLDVKISQNEFINCQERIKDLMVENEKIRDVCDRQAADLNDRKSVYSFIYI